MQDFWSPALPKVQIWRTTLGFVLLIAMFFAATFALFEVGSRLISSDPATMLGGGNPASASIFFATFIGFHIGLLIVLPLLHKRSYPTLFGPTRRLNLRHFAIGTAVTLALATFLYGVMFVERVFLPDGVEPTVRQIRPLSDWLVWLVPAIVLIFLQTFAEEALFRGYLLQQLRARFASVFVWAVLPSFIFGLLHFDASTYGTMNALAYVFNTTTTGILLCLITIRTGNLGAAAGLHFGNNAALIMIGIDGNLDGFSLFVVGMELESGYTAYSILSQTAFTLVLFTIWWFWMNRRDKIAKAGLPA
ncbi:type II CAAX endopeptidase family protein [uncultured Maritimibacter sp.]|uniref:CPBP family intramembrane glutamic endopeptidase n=1 Tax=uncultured Maritimibacter sp. TaxID=991866 RepID=UPI0025990B80|nr:type II CAAX endopeptidase family protein [uncultured Maritimibacter sp.]